MAVAHGRKRRCQDDSLHVRVSRSSQHAQRSVSRRNDELVLRLGLPAGEGRGYVLDVRATTDGLGPPLVADQIGHAKVVLVETTGTSVPERPAHVVLSRSGPDGGAHLVSEAEKLSD